jgi:bifunctional DNase/RNase
MEGGMGLIPFAVTENSVVYVRGELGMIPILLIKAGGINLPFGVGGYDAQYIKELAAGSEPDERSPDDLMRNIILALGASLAKVAITGASDDSFLARIYLKKDVEEFSLPSFPSDAIILGLSFKVPMLIEEDVLIAGTSNEDTQQFLSIIQEQAPYCLES